MCSRAVAQRCCLQWLAVDDVIVMPWRRINPFRTFFFLIACLSMRQSHVQAKISGDASVLLLTGQDQVCHPRVFLASRCG